MLNWQIDSSWTLFLDRDGVINERIMGGYVTNIDEFFFLQGVPEAIATFTPLFSNIFVITNQQGIAKKLMTERNLLDIHSYMIEELSKNKGKITKCYFAPGFKNEENSSRKPNPTMGLLAQKEYPTIDFNKSIMVGDTDSDIKFGKNLGMKTIRIRTEEKITIEADFTFDSLLEFAKILEYEK
jgi:D-glycero-D-manno-heptose 1,7-bisphosphate phosphatase